MDEQSTTPETARELKFDHWCIVELMGHQRIAGRVTEVNLFGSALMRVDVPEVDGAPDFSKFFGAGAIYAITPVEEKIARAMAKSFDQRPVVEWELRRLLPEPIEDPADEDDDDFEYEDDRALQNDDRDDYEDFAIGYDPAIESVPSEYDDDEDDEDIDPNDDFREVFPPREVDDEP